MNRTPKIRVLVVDDSALVRKMITDALSKDPQIEVVGTAGDPYVARDKILALDPDVVTLDIEMPRMDGLTFLKILQQHRPLPVIIVSSLTQAGSRAALEALEAGAVDVLAKPGTSYSIGDLGKLLASRVKGAAAARCRGELALAPTNPAPAVREGATDPRQMILIGASTGGVEALKQVLPQLPDGLPGICVVQHIPPHFSKFFAERLDQLCAFEVREAADGDALRPGLALVAPGDYHMVVNWVGDAYRVSLNQKPPLHHCRPAVDVLFHSAAACAGSKALGVLLTGMGCDGALGMGKLKAAGARTLAQDERTCVVYGMPRAAVEAGVVDQVLPLSSLPQAIVHWADIQAGAPAPALGPRSAACVTS
jgi:two-component system chemotaxis response regulator CheB